MVGAGHRPLYDLVALLALLVAMASGLDLGGSSV
jgi:hypothetical protein